jgi:hypothetical protein
MVGLPGEHPDDVHDREPPCLGGFILAAVDFLAFENSEVFIHDDGNGLLAGR